MKTVRFHRQWPAPEIGGIRTYPGGWRGEVPEDVAASAIGDGAAVEDDAGDGGDAFDGMTREQLDEVARRQGMDPAEYRTKADLIAVLRHRG